jgi:hypothetical protein
MTSTAALAPLTVDLLMQQSGVQFGTSGARGEVVAMTDHVCYYTQGFLSYLCEIGEYSGGRVALAGICAPARRAFWPPVRKPSAIWGRAGVLRLCSDARSRSMPLGRRSPA